MEELQIEFHRGDYYEYRFQILDDEGNSTQLGNNDTLFLSVKYAYNCTDYILQKTLDNGILWDEDNDCYLAVFEHEDTKNINRIQEDGYVFDVTIVYEGQKPETHTGIFNLLYDVTRNEVQSNANTTA